MVTLGMPARGLRSRLRHSIRGGIAIVVALSLACSNSLVLRSAVIGQMRRMLHAAVDNLPVSALAYCQGNRASRCNRPDRN
jgi:hypothetical protein